MSNSMKPKLSNIKEQFQDLKTNALTIPNLLSVLRIIAVPVFVYFFNVGNYKLALLVIFLSGLTDLFDGKIARHFNQISNLGKLLDPAADKLTQITVTIVYFREFYYSDDKALKAFSWVFFLFVAKEVMMIIGSFILLSINVVPEPAIIYGKVATVVFYLVMGLLMLFAPVYGAFNDVWTMPNPLIMILVTISASLTIVAFCSYMPDTARQIKEKRKDNSTETEEQS